MKHFLAIALAALATTVSASSETVANVSGQQLIRELDIEQKLDFQVPLDMEFRDETGSTVSLSKYFTNRPVLVTPIYYQCPSICNATLNGLVKMLRVIDYLPGRDFEIVTFSFDPRESAAIADEKKINYVQALGKPGVEKGWHFLTGDQDSITSFTDALGFRYKWDPKLAQFAHPAGIFMLTPKGRISRVFYGTEFSPRDVRLSLVDSSQGKIGSPVEKLLLLCYNYDAMTGKYSMALLGVMRIAATITIILLGVGLAIAFLREKRTLKSKVGDAT